MNSFKRIIFAGILCITILCTGFNALYAQESVSQKMVNILPDDVIFFMETSGGDALKPDFEKTILGRIWNEPSVQSFYQSIEKTLTDEVQNQAANPEIKEVISIAQTIINLAGSRPIIIGAAQKDTTDGPPIYGFAFLDAGSKKDQIDAFIKSLEAKAGDEIAEVKVGTNTFHGPRDDNGVPGYWGWIGNYLVFAINDGEGLAIKYVNGTANRNAQNYLQKSSITNDALGIYFNVEKSFDLIKAIAKMEGEDEQLAVIETVLSKLGLDKMKSISSRTGFVNSGVVVEELVEMQQPLTGIFANFKPVNLDMFNMASSNSISVSAANCNIAGIYDTIFNTLKSVAGEPFEEVEQGIAQMENQLQFKIRDGLLASLDGKMLFYQVPVAASLQGGFVVVLGLKDAQLWKDSIAAISNLATAMGNGMVQVDSQDVDGRTLNTIAIVPLAVAQVMPTWTIVGDYVVIGSSPTVCTAAADQAAPAARAKSIRSNENFQKATANLPSNVLSISYVDSKIQMTQMMTALQQAWQMATPFITQQTGMKLPIILPNLTNILGDVTPSMQYTYLDEKGIHSVYKGSGIEPGMAFVAGGAFGAAFAGITMPAIVRTRQISTRMVTGTNLSQIGKAMLIYANDYDDMFPPNLEELAEKMDLLPRQFESERKPADFDGPSFIYITGQTTSDHPANVLVYENPAFCSDGVNVLYLDSHVQFVTKDRFMKDLEETYKRLRKPMPEIKFKD